MAGALEGLRIADLTRGLPGAIATFFLADHGADVVHVGPPGGDPLAREPAFLTWQRGKRSILLDLRQPTGQEAARDLATRADVFLESFRPGVAERMGLGEARLRQDRPGLIYVSISAYGQRGPYAHRPGYDGQLVAASGLQWEQTTHREGPTCYALPLASWGAGLLALQGILAALHVRDRTGLGQGVATSLYQGAIAYRAAALAFDAGALQLPGRGGDPQGNMPAYRIYPAGDGKYLHLGCLTPEFWNKLAIAMDLIELVTDPRFAGGPLSWPREEDRLAAIALIGARLRERPRGEWLHLLEAGDVPCAPVRWTEELRDDAQARENGLLAQVDDPHRGRMLQIGQPARLFETPGTIRGPAPLPGQHTAQVLDELKAPPPPGLRTPPSPARPPAAPLEGLRVVDFSAFIAGPLCPMMLGDLGADVIKGEPLTGDAFRAIEAHFVAVNRGKRGLAVDLKRPQGREIARRLVARADIVAHNMRSAAAGRLGLDYNSLARIKPDLIYLHAAAYGARGPEAHKPGYDPLFQSSTGITAAQGGRAHPPVFLRPPVCDITTPLVSVAAILMALHVRNRTGRGQKIETSLLGNGLLLNAEHFLDYQGKPEPRLLDLDQYGFSALYRLYPAAEGWLFLACLAQKEWTRLCPALGAPALAADPRFATPEARARNDAALVDRLAPLFRTRSAQEWVQVAIAHDLPLERAAEDYLEGWFDNPQAQALGMVVAHDHPDYPGLRQLGTLVELSLTPARFRQGPPSLGQHTDEVLRELGFNSSEIGAYHEAGVVGGH